MEKLWLKLPSDVSLFGVLCEAPSPDRKLGLANGGVWTRKDELDGFRVEMGADIDGRRLTKLNGLPSSESLSPVPPSKIQKIKKLWKERTKNEKKTETKSKDSKETKKAAFSGI